MYFTFVFWNWRMRSLVIQHWYYSQIFNWNEKCFFAHDLWTCGTICWLWVTNLLYSSSFVVCCDYTCVLNEFTLLLFNSDENRLVTWETEHGETEHKKRCTKALRFQICMMLPGCVQTLQCNNSSNMTNLLIWFACKFTLQPHAWITTLKLHTCISTQ